MESVESVPATIIEEDVPKLRGRFALVVASAALISGSLLLSFVVADPLDLSQPLAILAILIGMAPITASFVSELLDRRFGVDGLVVVAVAATALLGEYAAAAIVALMLNAGELLEDYISNKSRRSLHALLKGAPHVAHVPREGEEKEVPVDTVEAGMTLVARTGDLIPVDGVVLSGRASVNEAALTGEPFPVPKTKGSELLSGSLVEAGYLLFEASSPAEDSTYSRIISLVRQSLARRAPIERIADRYARWFAPVILAVAFGAWWLTADIVRAISVLVVACPCSLVLATPTAVVASMGKSAKRGVLVKGGDVIETAAKVQAVLFDKTGTLTLSSPRVVGMVPIAGVEPDEVLSLAASAELYSEHALGKAIVREAKRRELPISEPDEFEVLPGMGVLSEANGMEVLVGNEELLRHVGVDVRSQETLPDGASHATTKVLVARDGRLVGALYLEDTPRTGVRETVQALRRQGIQRFGLITGDEVEAARQVATLAGIAEVQGSLLPEDKVRVVETLRDQDLAVLMAGDGVNDAPALAAADVAVAVGDTATDASLEVADVALLEADLEKIAWFVTHARRTRRIILQNILLGLGLNLGGILLAFLGWISPLGAAALHEGNALVVVLNSARLAFGP